MDRSLNLAFLNPKQLNLLDTKDALVDPFRIRHYVRLCDAIERFVSGAIASDFSNFRVRAANLRYVVERHLFFALITDRRLYRYFVAHECGDPDDGLEGLSAMARLVAPYLSREKIGVTPSASPPILTRIVRTIYRRQGHANVRCEGKSRGNSKVLFLVIHPKFVRYLLPIAEALPMSSAFLTIDDPETFGYLRSEGLARVGIELSRESWELTKESVKVVGVNYVAGPLEYFAIKFNAIRRALAALRPSCIVVPEGNAPVCELVNRVTKTLSIQTLCVQQGWAPLVHPGFRNMTYNRMCVWGRGFAELLSPYNPDENFVATGNHILTCRRQQDDLTRNAIAFFLQKGNHLTTEAAWSSMLELIAWTARNFPNSEVRVREHPSAPLSESELSVFNGFPNVRLKAPGEATLDDALVGCHTVVAMDSTTILEGAATGAVPLILNVNGYDHYNPNIAADGGAVEVEDFATARSALSRLILDDEYRRSFADGLDRVRERFFAGNGDEALAAMVSEIMALAREPRAGKLTSMLKRHFQ
jgi:hypothetical protein